MTDFEFDIAFSLLALDEHLATRIRQLLPDAVRVFFYTERQLELVGNDGVEEFSAAFARKARTVAVLFRRGWGQTKWTAIEADAIRTRRWNTGADFITLIRLDDEPIPDWFPATRIWGDIDRLGPEGVAAVLVERSKHLGAAVREESAVELAQRLSREREAESRRLAFLGSERGVARAREEASQLTAAIEALGPKIGADVSKEARGTLVGAMLYRDGFSANATWHSPYSNTLNGSELRLTVWRGRPDHGERRFFNFEDPTKQSTDKFDFEMLSADDFAWRQRDGGRVFSTLQLADLVGRQLLQAQGRHK